MSKISLQPNASGTAVFALVAPDSNTNRTLTLPDEAGVVLTDTSDIAADKLTGDIAADRMKDGFNASGSAPVYACRAWVNFNGKGTVAIRASGNVSSITDRGTGRYTVNFVTAMPDANYSISGWIGDTRMGPGGTFFVIHGDTDERVSSGQYGIMTKETSQGATDYDDICTAVFR